MGGFIWRMNHDIAHGRIQSTPGIEQDLVNMQENIEYAVDQLTRFGIEDPKGKNSSVGRDNYWKWFRAWENYFSHVISDEDLAKVSEILEKDYKDPCEGFRPKELMPVKDERK